MPEEITVDEEVILVEFDEEAGLQPAARGVSEMTDELVEKSQKAIQKAMGTIRNMATRTVETVKELSDPPDQVEVAFGIKLDAEAGAVVARAGTEANINVKLSWRKEQKPMARLSKVGLIPTQKEG